MEPSINVNWVPGITLEEMEKQCILAAFRFYRGNKTTTAQVLGIAIRTLDNKLEKYEADALMQKEKVEQDELKRRAIHNRLRGVPDQPDSGSISPPRLEFGSRTEEEKRREQSFRSAGQNVSGTDEGVRVQSPEELSGKQPMSVSKREEVQKVLPRPAAGNSHRGRR
jgi:hypothetical protein